MEMLLEENSHNIVPVFRERMAKVSLIHCLPVRITPRSNPAIKSSRSMRIERN